MPEGHHIHRLARDLTEAYGGLRPRVASPQGRFADAAALLDETMLERSWAVGKHLFIGWVGDRVVHIHLGLIGKLRPFPWPGGPGEVRLRIGLPEVGVYDLSGPQTCRLVTGEEAAQVAAESGPDPLDPGADRERAWTRLHRSRRTIAALLMDQSMFAGVGNIYRAEVLYRAKLHPYTEGRDVPRRTFDAIWDDLVELMPLGVRDDRIDTVRPEHTPEAMGRPPRIDRHGGEVYVYRRHEQHCLVCGREVRREDHAGRNLYWCATCQRRRPVKRQP
ncbi:MAG TPA: zinc finger domain-containing protein [Propionibacteriaceae bacterium]|nr:zinc finger domain-containing protein [Propionibacteriaceae bacterium]